MDIIVIFIAILAKFPNHREMHCSEVWQRQMHSLRAIADWLEAIFHKLKTIMQTESLTTI